MGNKWGDILLIRLWKESLNSDGYRFHQYQQNEQSPLILTELTETQKRSRYIITFEIQVLAWDRHKHVAVLNSLKGSQPFPLDNWQYICKQTI